MRRKIRSAPFAYDQRGDHRVSRQAPCGTACCIGGWADILSAPNKAEKQEHMADNVNLNRAANTLGLKGRDFYSEPEPFRSQWKRARTYIQRSAVAVAYLTHIIETGKVLE